ncbi:MAG: nitrite/sulfite reductase [Vicinamibacterales bacterium]
MAPTEVSGSTGRSRLSFADEAEIDEFVDVLGRFERGEIAADQWRAFRLVRGTYGQRQSDDAQMLRVKIPQGLLTGTHIEALADVADRYSRGFGHITTRQNVQFHFLKLHDVEGAMRRLGEAGLTTREACGNSVRNITCCPYAGVAADEVFDVTPYSEALTRYLLRHPLSAALPRKFKIAFEGCPVDHIGTGINDIGFTARLQTAGGDERRGFRITVAGGTSTLARSGQVLFEFCPAGQILDAAEGIIRVYHRLGDYKHKQRNRLKFLVRSLGWDGFKAEFDQEFERIRTEGGAPLPFDPAEPPVEAPPEWQRPAAPSLEAVAARAQASVVRGPGIVPQVSTRLTVHSEELLAWAASNVRSQKQQGYAIVTVATLLGDVTAEQMRLLAELASAFGDGTVRVTMDQNAVLRWVRSADVPGLYERLAAAGLARGGAGTLSDVVSCPGAESCRLAVTQSRGLGRLLADNLAGRADLVAALPELDIKISGCPNGCGQHHIAGIGFQGSLRKVGGRPAPHYFVLVGGGTTDGVTTFGRVAATVPARRAFEALERLTDLYTETRAPGESARTFFRRIELPVAKAALAHLERLAPEAAVPEDFIDLGEDHAFTPEVMDGECSA